MLHAARMAAEKLRQTVILEQRRRFELRTRDLRVGKARVTLRFRRRSDGRTSYRILDQRGKLHVVRQATPWSLTTQPAERLRDALSSLLPGR